MVDIRWKQRFQNLNEALGRLDELVQKDGLNWIEATALIKMFEIVFELSWKTLKDYLLEQGITVKSPRDTIKQAYQMDLLDDGDTWLDAMEKRNTMVHRYDEEFSKMLTGLIQGQYAPCFRALQLKLSQKSSDE